MPDGRVLKSAEGKVMKPDTYEEPQLEKILNENY